MFLQELGEDAIAGGRQVATRHEQEAKLDLPVFKRKSVTRSFKGVKSGGRVKESVYRQASQSNVPFPSKGNDLRSTDKCL